MSTMTPTAPAVDEAPELELTASGALPVSASLHPDCPDWRRVGPTPLDASLRAQAARVESDDADRTALWSRGFNRRRLLKGGLGVGVAMLGQQLVTTRVSYAAEATGTLVVVFLRGGQDGLSVLVPGADPDLARLRPGIAVGSSSLIPLGRGFGLHPAMAPLRPLINAGQLAAIPAVSTPDLSRSHFQAMDCLERGGEETGSRSGAGWLDRVLAQAGTGTTFRSVAMTGTMPRALSGPQGSLAMRGLDALTMVGQEKFNAPTQAALSRLFTGLDHPMAPQVGLALDAWRQGTQLRTAEANQGRRGYPSGTFADALRNVATMIREGAGIRVACIDVGGWDTHTGMGTPTSGDMQRQLASMSTALAAFASDLGGHLSTTTVVTMTEFGRRVEQNASAGTDHGHGAVVLAMGGGVRGGVHGRWEGLSNGVLQDGDVPGLNDYRDVLSEVIMKRVGLSSSQAQNVFGGRNPNPVGFMA